MLAERCRVAKVPRDGRGGTVAKNVVVIEERSHPRDVKDGVR
jgi:hypothetical protein